jgi:hypothetical protein
MEYRIRIVETASKVLYIDAVDEQTAVDIVSDQYSKAEIVLDWEDYDCTDIMAI